ncbi:CoB--CoM heterodisulfide reductase iron-sulfur subunit B family protein [Candidatus Bathyarchaeota archaeon]|nr:CoB--CoM heterodisulfide reductase iron-sulfur subunit B family protein [Candidatus Bathyarchaeota archaeon]MCK4669468.1 CoB--CoM heterodisulfide reductase iron-sulfur subunit B family protein [Candidatus Bathyarchaeota archaeon]
MPELKYLFFLGCVIPYRLPSYEVSARKVLEKLGVELVEMPEFNCCGFPMDPINHDLMLTLAARNLCLAEKQNLNILTLCNGCFGILNDTNKTLKEDKEIREKINDYLKEIGMEFNGTIEVKHLVHALTEDVGLKKIKDAVRKPLTQLQVAQHTGCHIVRPAKHVGRDDPENPTMLKNLIKLTGAECLDYMDETECCGNPIIGVNEEVPFQLVREKLEHIKAVKAQALVTVCPACHMMYDLYQTRIERVFNEKFGLPVLHYTQLLGLAMGFTPEELLMNALRVKPTEILSQIQK